MGDREAKQETSEARAYEVMARHSRCEGLRLVDQCVSCNPGYGDNDQAHWIYRHQKRTGCDLRTAERAYLAAHGYKVRESEDR